MIDRGLYHGQHDDFVFVAFFVGSPVCVACTQTGYVTVHKLDVACKFFLF